MIHMTNIHLSALTNHGFTDDPGILSRLDATNDAMLRLVNALRKITEECP